MNNNTQESLDRVKASDPSYSVWVSASAGSGKTTVLVKRLLRMLLEGIQPSKILCITFTNTGASEMRNRINSALAKWTVLNDDDLKKQIITLVGNNDNIENNISRARTLFTKIIDNSNDFKILTIHSFCQQIIKRFPLEANIIPNFQIADDILADELLCKAESKILEINDEKIKNAIDLIFKYKNEEQFLELLKKIINQKDNLLYLRSKFSTVDGVIYEISKLFNIGINETENEIINNFKNSSKLKEYFDNEKINLIKETAGISDTKSINKIEKLLNSKEIKICDLKEYLLVFYTSTKDKIRDNVFTPKIIKIYPELQDFIDCETKLVINLNEKLNDFVNFQFTSAFIRIAYHLFNIYDNLKKQSGYLDYGDLIFETNKLLNDKDYKNLDGENFCSSWVNYKLDEGISHILVDEAQDTSPIQWEIIKSITEEFFSGYGQQGNENKTIFVVGDEKQSIFSFQGAKPDNLNVMLNYYKEKIEGCKKNFANISLQTSFRSLQTILKVTDEVFSDEERRKAITKLNNKIIHHLGRENQGLGKVEIWPLINVENEEENNEEDDENKNGKKIKEAVDWKINYLDDIEETGKQKLAKIIANKITYWFKNKKIIYSRKDKCERPLKYSDIMILVRSRKDDFTNSLIKQLNKSNILTMGNDRFKINDNIISQDILSLCKFILFNEDDLNLANIFKSPFLNMTEDDLYKLCMYKNKNNCSLWQAMQDNIEYNDKTFLLKSIIEYSSSSTIYELLFFIFDKLNLRKNIKKRFSYLTDDILNEFLKIANEYSNSHTTSTLLNFISFIETSDLEIKRDMDQSVDEIKIITVHSAKGLESPIVILPDTNHLSQSIDKIDNILNYKAVDDIDYTIPLLQKEKSLFTEKVKDDMKNDTENEYLRLLYVAITRAENELYICDSDTKKSNKKDTWYKILDDTIKDNSKVKTKYDEIVKDNIYYIGDDDKFANNNELKKDSNNSLKSNEEIDSIIEKISSDIKEKNSIKVINPSIYYSENAINNPTVNTDNIEKGKIVHKLLEILPNIKNEEWNNAIDIYLKDNIRYKDEVKNIVLNILNNKEFNFIFSENSKSEVPIFGKINNNIISGQIDRLSIIGNKLYIIDYKNTNSLPKTVPEKYKEQLGLYKELLQKIYKDKTIECYILWTSFGIMQEVEK